MSRRGGGSRGNLADAPLRRNRKFVPIPADLRSLRGDGRGPGPGMVAAGTPFEVSIEAMFDAISGFSDALDANQAAVDLASVVESSLAGSASVGGAIVFSTSASGSAGPAIGRALAERWPTARLVGTSFEGVVAEGRVFRDVPATGIVAWSQVEGEPIPLLLESNAFEAGADATDDLEHLILSAAGRDVLAEDDLILLFPDSLASGRIEASLAEVAPRLGHPVIAGAAASGLAGAPCQAWASEGLELGHTIGLWVRGGGGRKGAFLEQAGASRFASPWLEIGACRGGWIDELEGEKPLAWVRRQLGLEKNAPVTPHLDRLLVRIRDRQDLEEAPDEDLQRVTPDESAADFVERYVVGFDDRRGSISVPGAFRRGGHLAFALPDADWARTTLRSAVAGLPKGGLLLQFGCRARDHSLHGDGDLETALVAHERGGCAAVGTIAPFQLGPDQAGHCRVLVHSTVLATFGS